jgi:hypothetical protein
MDLVILAPYRAMRRTGNSLLRRMLPAGVYGRYPLIGDSLGHA